jgi:Uma2 family endonuclease
MSAIPKKYMSEAEYLEMERAALTKSEYYKGDVFAMAGATKEHNAIVASILGELYSFLKGSNCKIYPSDLRVYNAANSLYTYPDIIIVCGKEEYLDDSFDSLLNPTVLFEVLSPATEDYDRGTKFKLYRTIASLQNYVLVSSTEFAAEVYTRKEDENWLFTSAKDREAQLYLSAINYRLKLLDVYAQVGELRAGR